MRPVSENTCRAKPEEAGSGNPDPTMRHPAGSPKGSIKGENMPPLGGEDIAPADSDRSPKLSQEQAKEADKEGEAPEG